MTDFTLHFKLTHGGKTHRFSLNPSEYDEPLVAVLLRVSAIVDALDKRLNYFWRDANLDVFPLETPEHLDAAIDDARTPKEGARGPPCIYLAVLVTDEEEESDQAELVVQSSTMTMDDAPGGMSFDEAAEWMQREQRKAEHAQWAQSMETITDELRRATAALQGTVLDMQHQQLQQLQQTDRIERLLEIQEERALYYSPEECGPACDVEDDQDETRPYFYTPFPDYEGCSPPRSVVDQNESYEPEFAGRPVCDYSGYTGCLFSCCDAAAQYAVRSQQRHNSMPLYARWAECFCDECLVGNYNDVDEDQHDVITEEVAYMRERFAAVEFSQALQADRFEMRQNILLEKLMQLEEMIRK